MPRTNKRHKKSQKNNKKTNKANRRHKGGAEYYAPVGDPDRDSVDVGMENALAKLGISNAPEGEQSGWLSVSILGIIAVGGLGYLLIKGKR
jgi:hypothetical protein